MAVGDAVLVAAVSESWWRQVAASARSAEAQLTQELTARGLPEPISIKRIEGYQASGRPMVRWLEFQTRRFKGTSGKGLAGFEIEFGEPVAGPIAVGFGCHFGLGLFMPC